MNKIFLALLLLITCFSYAQERIRKNEFSFSTIKVSTPAFYDYTNVEPLNFGANIIYKRRIYDNFYFRASQSYYRYSLGFGNFCFSCVNYERMVQEINTSSGVEFRYFKTKKGKFILHSGFDASLFIHQFKQTNRYREFEIVSSTNYHRNAGLGIQAFSGMSIYPTKKLVLSMEGSLLIGFHKTKYSFIENNGFTPQTMEDGGFQPYAQLFLLRNASIGWRF